MSFTSQVNLLNDICQFGDMWFILIYELSFFQTIKRRCSIIWNFNTHWAFFAAAAIAKICQTIYDLALEYVWQIDWLADECCAPGKWRMWHGSHMGEGVDCSNEYVWHNMETKSIFHLFFFFFVYNTYTYERKANIKKIHHKINNRWQKAFHKL